METTGLDSPPTTTPAVWISHDNNNKQDRKLGAKRPSCLEPPSPSDRPSAPPPLQEKSISCCFVIFFFLSCCKRIPAGRLNYA